MKKLFTLIALFTPVAAFAHPGHGGFEAGLLHPLTGFDHLLAMVAVGMLALRTGGKAVWVIPAGFVVALATGGMLGITGTTVGMTETMIALSLVVFGALLVMQMQLKAIVGVTLTMGFGLFHGLAHGAEAVGTPGAFMLGMVLTSALLHGAGLLLAKAGKAHWAQQLTRAGGALIAFTGGALLMS